MHKSKCNLGNKSNNDIIIEIEEKMKIGIGNDHVAVEYKNVIREYIEAKYGYEVINYGTDSSERFNYPVSGEAVANAVVNGEVDKGIVIYSGTGVEFLWLPTK